MTNYGQDHQGELQAIQEAVLKNTSKASESHTQSASDAVLSVVKERIAVQGCDFDKVAAHQATLDFENSQSQDRLSLIMNSFRGTGFQATNIALAIEQINLMRSWRPPRNTLDEHGIPETPEPGKDHCKIFLGYTSNLVSSGCRDIFRFLVQHRMVDVVVTTAGGIEEDFIKCMNPLLVGDFKLDGKTLRSHGINRIGNLLMPNENYCTFEDWLTPILDECVEEQVKQGTIWSPSKLIRRMGERINNEESIYYWAWRNNIPVFCPGITDGSIGDMIFFHTYKQDDDKQLILDLVQDVRALNAEAVRAACTGMIVLGGGIVKHHICNANLMRNGAEFAVFVNTGVEYDGSDSGASPDEAVSWGKIKTGAKPVKVSCDATIAFPLIVAETFAKERATTIRETLNRHSDTLYM